MRGGKEQNGKRGWNGLEDGQASWRKENEGKGNYNESGYEEERRNGKANLVQVVIGRTRR